MKKTALAVSLLLAILSAVSCSGKSENAADKAETTTIVTTAEAETTTEADATTEAAISEVELPDPAEGTGFKSATIEGNVYTSEYAGMEISFSDDMEIDDRAATEEEIKQMWSMFDSEYQEMLKKEIIEVQAHHDYEGFIVTYYNTKLMFPDEENVTEDHFIEKGDIVLPATDSEEELQQILDEEGAVVTGPEKITMGGKEYSKVFIKLEGYGLDLIYYVRKIDDDFTLVIMSQGETGFDHTKFEKSVSSV